MACPGRRLASQVFAGPRGGTINVSQINAGWLPLDPAIREGAWSFTRVVPTWMASAETCQHQQMSICEEMQKRWDGDGMLGFAWYAKGMGVFPQDLWSETGRNR